MASATAGFYLSAIFSIRPTVWFVASPEMQMIPRFGAQPFFRLLPKSILI